jgi:hypothetical protein
LNPSNGCWFVNGLYFINEGAWFDAEVAAQNYKEPGKAKDGQQIQVILAHYQDLLFFREKRMITRTNGKTMSWIFMKHHCEWSAVCR